MRHRTLPLLLAALAPAALGALLAPPEAASADATVERPFSRTRWIRERKQRLRLDETPWEIRRATAPAVVDPLPLPAPAGLRNVRVSRDLLGNGAAPGQRETQAEPFLAADPANESFLLAAYQEGRFESGGARTLTYAWSANGGRRWTEGRLPGLTLDQGGSYERVSDPWVAFGPDHRAYYVSLAFDETTPRNGLYVSASADGGRSWGAPVEVHANVHPDFFDDKQSMVVDTRADSPFRGRVYVGWDTATIDRQILRVAWSEDEGMSFRPAVDLVNQANRGNVGIVMAVGPGGVLHAVWTMWLPGPAGIQTVLLTSRSQDGGQSWSPALRIADQLAAGVAGMRTGEILSSLAVDPRDGTLYLAWQDSRFTPGVDQVVLSRSPDGGATWTEPVRVSDGPADAAAFTPVVAVNGQGHVGVAYYTLRHDRRRNNWTDLYLSVSRDGGASFGAGRRISGRSFPASAAARSRGWFYGDYQGLVAGQKVFRPLFVATLAKSRFERRRTQPDVFVASVPP